MAQPWYEGGLRFECTECGDCCRREGDVFVTRAEAEAIVAFLYGDDATVAAFAGELWEEEFDGSLRVDVPRGAACPFLSVKGRCTIHAIKPAQCATYPFWAEILASARDWSAESRWCEGIGRGPTFDLRAIARRLDGQD